MASNRWREWRDEVGGGGTEEVGRSTEVQSHNRQLDSRGEKAKSAFCSTKIAEPLFNCSTVSDPPWSPTRNWEQKCCNCNNSNCWLNNNSSYSNRSQSLQLLHLDPPYHHHRHPQPHHCHHPCRINCHCLSVRSYHRIPWWKQITNLGQFIRGAMGYNSTMPSLRNQFGHTTLDHTSTTGQWRCGDISTMHLFKGASYRHYHRISKKRMFVRSKSTILKDAPYFCYVQNQFQQSMKRNEATSTDGGEDDLGETISSSSSSTTSPESAIARPILESTVLYTNTTVLSIHRRWHTGAQVLGWQIVTRGLKEPTVEYNDFVSGWCY